MSRPKRSSLPTLALCIPLVLVLGLGIARAGLDAADWKKALSALDDAVVRKDARAIGEAALAVAKDDSLRAAKALTAAAVASAGTGAHEDVAAAIATFTDPKARDFIVKNATKHKDSRVRWLFTLALGASDWPEAGPGLVDAINGKDVGLAQASIRAIRKKRTKESIELLIAFMEERDRERPPNEFGSDAVREEAISALRDLTGQTDLTDGVDWRNWWAQNADGFDPSAPGKSAPAPGRVGTVVDRLKQRRPGAYETLERLEKDDIIVVTGIYDQCQDVLRALGLPYTLVQRAEFDKVQLDPKQVVIFNCDEASGKLSPDAQKRLLEFTARGGYVFTSDWELVNVIAPVYPKTMSMAATTDELEVGITPAKGNEHHPLLRDVFPADPFKAAAFKWHIDGLSYTIRPGPDTAVLVHSDELEGKYGSGIVAATFRVGAGRVRPPRRPTSGRGGRSGTTTDDEDPEGSYADELRGGSVLHVLSHFQKQKDESGDGFALQQMLLNFIVEKQAYRAAEARRKKK